MKIDTLAVHAGDRKRAPEQIPVTTPIHLAASFIAGSAAEQDRIFAEQQAGFVYQRYANPTNEALEEQISALEGGSGALATASGMNALQVALTAALLDRRRRVLCARDIYGATIKLLMDLMGPFGVETEFCDMNDLAEVEAQIARFQPGALLLETISNPLLRVPAIDRIADLARAAGAALIVDNTFATPLLVRPLELGAHISVHSATKYLAGHGDVLGGLVVSGPEHLALVRRIARVCGPVLGPVESYLAMRGIKTFALRVERQCRNARALAAWLRSHPAAGRVYFPDDPAHPDAATIGRLLPNGLFGAMLSFELKDAGRERVFAFLDRLRMVVHATSLGDVHTMILYPWISSHRDVPPRQRDRMGIRENLVRISAGIEAFEDIRADLGQALG